jgi:hypothetical protein
MTYVGHAQDVRFAHGAGPCQAFIPKPCSFAAGLFLSYGNDLSGLQPVGSPRVRDCLCRAHIPKSPRLEPQYGCAFFRLPGLPAGRLWGIIGHCTLISSLVELKRECRRNS